MKIKIAFPGPETANAVSRVLNPNQRIWENNEQSFRFFNDTREGVFVSYSDYNHFISGSPDVPEVSYEDLCAAVQNRLSISEVIGRAIARRRSER